MDLTGFCRLDQLVSDQESFAGTEVIGARVSVSAIPPDGPQPCCRPPGRWHPSSSCGECWGWMVNRFTQIPKPSHLCRRVQTASRPLLKAPDPPGGSFPPSNSMSQSVSGEEPPSSSPASSLHHTEVFIDGAPLLPAGFLIGNLGMQCVTCGGGCGHPTGQRSIASS